MSTGERDESPNTPWTNTATPRYDDFGELIHEADPVIEPRLQVWHAVNARSHMLAGNHQKAIDILSHPFLPPESVDDMRVVLRAHHLAAEAHLELGGRANVAAAVRHAIAGFTLASEQDLGQEQIYADSLFIVLAEALRRSGDLGQNPSVIPDLYELMSQLGEESEEGEESPPRLKALQFVGFRTLALATRSSAERRYLQELAIQARDTYLRQAHTLLGDLSFTSDVHDPLLDEATRSAPLTLLIDFPFPSQGQAKLPNPTPRPRRR